MFKTSLEFTIARTITGTVTEYHHTGHYVCTAHVRDVVAFNPSGDFFQTQQIDQITECLVFTNI